MPLFRRRERPEYQWAGPLEGEELDAFVRDLRADMDRRGWRHEIGTDALQVTEPEQRVLGLHNLAQEYRLVRAAGGDAAAAIRTHFDNLLSADSQELPADFETVRPQLRMRLVAPDYVADVPAPPLARVLADDLIAVLAVDTPTAVHLPGREEVERWGREESELWEAALVGVRREKGLATRVHEIDGARITTLTGDSFYTATWALWAGELDPPAADHGALVAVPHRHAVLVHALRDVTALRALQHMPVMAESLYREGPGSISPSLYWLRGTDFERLTTVVTEKQVTIVPSEELVEVLNAL